MTTITIVRSPFGSFEGVYLNGTLIADVNHVDLKTLLEGLGYDVLVETRNDEWFAANGYRFPPDLSALRLPISEGDDQ